jgi:hypothetical protein
MVNMGGPVGRSQVIGDAADQADKRTPQQDGHEAGQRCLMFDVHVQFGW